MRLLLITIWLVFLGTFSAYAAASDNLPETQTFHLAESSVDDGGTMDMPEEDTSVSALPEPEPQRYLYSTLVQKPDRLFKGEIFQITLRTIVATNAFRSVQYNIIGGQGVKLLSSDPVRESRDHAYFDRFLFKVTGSRAVLPDIIPEVTLSSGATEDSAPIKGVSIDVTVLNPPKDYSGVLADAFTITHIKTTVYDKSHNIIVIAADANRSDLKDFHIPAAGKQNFESFRQNDLNSSSMSYYAVLPNTLETLHFQYFSLKTKQYERISIPIEIDNDLVSTISDLKPTDHGHDYQKTVIFATVAVVLFLLAIWRRNWFLFAFAAAAAGYAGWLSVPLRKVCINEGAPIYLLPMRNAPIFEQTPTRYELEQQGHIEGYTKVRLVNDKIGWVKDEDTCSR